MTAISRAWFRQRRPPPHTMWQSCPCGMSGGPPSKRSTARRRHFSATRPSPPAFVRPAGRLRRIRLKAEADDPEGWSPQRLPRLTHNGAKTGAGLGRACSGCLLVRPARGSDISSMRPVAAPTRGSEDPRCTLLRDEHGPFFQELTKTVHASKVAVAFRDKGPVARGRRERRSRSRDLQREKNGHHLVVHPAGRQKSGAEACCPPLPMRRAERICVPARESRAAEAIRGRRNRGIVVDTSAEHDARQGRS
jgi:hypothetical protein